MKSASPSFVMLCADPDYVILANYRSEFFVMIFEEALKNPAKKYRLDDRAKLLMIIRITACFQKSRM